MRRCVLGVLVLVLLLTGSGTSYGQIIQPVRRDNPLAFLSLSVGWLQQQAMCPDATTCWNFGSGPQWRGTIELPMGTGAGLGVVGTTARMPLEYRGTALSNSCVACEADASVNQIMAFLHLGGTSGFHQVIDVAAGYTMFSNFRRTSDGAKLGEGTERDFSFAIGYGFGYGFSQRTSVMIVQDYGLVIHGRQSGGSNNTAQQSNLRIGLRMGLGDKR